ncbi:hypothetical protein ABT009_45875 [Streptomyces sp. NPDC002896]|uniref:hypothetical protein n=1 Tax=Streptomyces sp. NPDC002896 TaxID=3154438 RepID=UPI00332F55CC
MFERHAALLERGFQPSLFLFKARLGDLVGPQGHQSGSVRPRGQSAPPTSAHSPRNQPRFHDGGGTED